MQDEAKDTATLRRKQRQQQFLALLIEESGLVSYACERMGISRQTHYNWFRTDAEYRRDFQKAATEARERRYRNVCESAFAAVRRGNQQMQRFIRTYHGEDALKAILAGMEPEL